MKLVIFIMSLNIVTDKLPDTDPLAPDIVNVPGIFEYKVKLLVPEVVVAVVPPIKLLA